MGSSQPSTVSELSRTKVPSPNSLTPHISLGEISFARFAPHR